jgi:hypothetical protein
MMGGTLARIARGSHSQPHTSTTRWNPVDNIALTFMVDGSDAILRRDSWKSGEVELTKVRLVAANIVSYSLR